MPEAKSIETTSRYNHPSNLIILSISNFYMKKMRKSILQFTIFSVEHNVLAREIYALITQDISISM